MSDPSAKLLVIAEDTPLLEKLSAMLAPCVEVEAASGRQEAARMAGENSHDAILWGVAAGQSDAARHSDIILQWNPTDLAAPDGLLVRLRSVLTENGWSQSLDEDVLSRETETRQAELKAHFEDVVREGETQRTELSRKAAQLESSLEDALAQAEALRKSLDESASEVERLREEQENQFRETKSLRQSLDETLIARDQARSTIERMSSEHLAERDAARLEAQKQQQELVDVRRELADLRKRAQESDSLMKALNGTIDSLRQEMASRERDAGAALAAAEAARDAALRQSSEAQAKLDKLQAQWEQIVRD